MYVLKVMLGVGGGILLAMGVFVALVAWEPVTCEIKKNHIYGNGVCVDLGPMGEFLKANPSLMQKTR